MSDDLVNYLRNSREWRTLGNAAADRIEELEAQLTTLVRALEEIRDIARLSEGVVFFPMLADKTLREAIQRNQTEE